MYIDLRNVLSDADGPLRKELKFDGLELTGVGYGI